MQMGDADNAEVPDDLPPQLLFVHGGQTDLKEVFFFFFFAIQCEYLSKMRSSPEVLCCIAGKSTQANSCCTER